MTTTPDSTAVLEPPPAPRRPRRPARHRAPSPAPVAPRQAEGIELIGEYEGSGFKEAPYIARRADGQVLQLTRLLYAVAEAADGRRDFAEMAERVSEETGRKVSRDNIAFLVEKKLRPLGVLAEADGTSPELERPDPLLALKFRTAVIPEGITRGLTTLFRPLFWPPVVVALVVGFAALDAWLFLSHGIAGGLRAAIYQPLLLLGLFGGVVVATAFHEIGHATACRYGGGRPGVMGVGIYVVWPAFYTDVTDAYRLGKAGRLRTDLGGIYFNAIFALAVAGAYALTAFEPLLLLIVIQNFAMLQQLLPFLRLDGYYIISDLTGVPDMFSRIKPVFRSLKPGTDAEPRVQELKPWVRVVVTAYVLTVVPVLLAALLAAILHAPRMVATAWDSLGVQYDKVSTTLGEGFSLGIVTGVLQMLMLSLPVLGLGLTFFRVGSRGGQGAWRWSSGRPERRAGLVTLTTACVALALVTWWPNGEYRPLQPGEKGTLQGALSAVADVPSGRPSLPPQREAALGGAPTVRELDGDARLERTVRERDIETLRRGEQLERPRPAAGETPTDDPDVIARPESSPSQDPDRSATPTPSPSRSAAPGATPTSSPSPAPTATPAPAGDATPAPAPASTPTPTPTPTPAATTTPAPTATPTPTPTPAP